MFRKLRDVFRFDEEILQALDDGNLSEIEELDDENNFDELDEAEVITQENGIEETETAEDVLLNDYFWNEDLGLPEIEPLAIETPGIEALLIEAPVNEVTVQENPPNVEQVRQIPVEIQEEEPEMISTCFTLKQAVKDYCLRNAITDKKNIVWRNIEAFETVVERFYEPPNHDLLELLSPYGYFQKYFPDTFWSETADFTNLFAQQANVPHFPQTCLEEIKKFVGVHLIMGNLGYPRVKLYWEPKFSIPLIHDHMTRKRFQKLRHCIHFVDNTQNPPDNCDRFWKVRPLFNSIRDVCYQKNLEANLCVDEQMVPFKGKCSAKQYIKDKPTKWGIKIFMLCGESGELYDFLIYQGKTTELDAVESNLGQCSAVVLHLCKRITTPNVHLYFDNMFNSYWLLQLLQQKEIYAAGTARIDRFAKPPFSTNKEMSERGRGTCEQVVSTDGIVLTKWNDNSIVTMASNFIGTGNMDTCRRWDKAAKVYIDVPRPQVVKRYNQSMGGVDKVDFLVAIYRTFIRSRKWTLRMFTHALDIAVTDAWLQYIRDTTKLNIPKAQRLDLIQFRQHVGEALILTAHTPQRKRGRPSNETPLPVHPKRQHAIHPVEDVRYDGKDHLPLFENQKNAIRCKNPGCNKRTFVICVKCKIALCVAREKNCFLDFHQK